MNNSFNINTYDRQLLKLLLLLLIDFFSRKVIYDQSQFGLLNSQIDDSSLSPSLLSDSPRNKKPLNKLGKLTRTAALCGAYISLVS